MNLKSHLILIFLVSIVITFTISTGCLGLNPISGVTAYSNFQQVTHVGVTQFMQSSGDEGLRFRPSLHNDKSEVLEWSNVPITYDIKIYTEVLGDIHTKDQLIYNKTGIVITSSCDSGKLDDCTILVPYSELPKNVTRVSFTGKQEVTSLSKLRGFTVVTVHLPDGRVLTGELINTYL